MEFNGKKYTSIGRQIISQECRTEKIDAEGFVESDPRTITEDQDGTPRSHEGGCITTDRIRQTRVFTTYTPKTERYKKSFFPTVERVSATRFTKSRLGKLAEVATRLAAGTLLASGAATMAGNTVAQDTMDRSPVPSVEAEFGGAPERVRTHKNMIPSEIVRETSPGPSADITSIQPYNGTFEASPLPVDTKAEINDFVDAIAKAQQEAHDYAASQEMSPEEMSQNDVGHVELTIVGTASDEAGVNGDPNANIGRPNANNERLAEGRGEVTAQEVRSVMEARGISNVDIVEVSGEEQVLEPKDIASLNQIASQKNMSFAELIQAYNAGDTQALAGVDTVELDQMFKNQRGARMNTTIVRAEKSPDVGPCDSVVTPITKEEIIPARDPIDGKIYIIPVYAPAIHARRKYKRTEVPASTAKHTTIVTTAQVWKPEQKSRHATQRTISDIHLRTGNQAKQHTLDEKKRDVIIVPDVDATTDDVADLPAERYVSSRKNAKLTSDSRPDDLMSARNHRDSIQPQPIERGKEVRPTDTSTDRKKRRKLGWLALLPLASVLTTVGVSHEVARNEAPEVSECRYSEVVQQGERYDVHGKFLWQMARDFVTGEQSDGWNFKVSDMFDGDRTIVREGKESSRTIVVDGEGKEVSRSTMPRTDSRTYYVPGAYDDKS